MIWFLTVPTVQKQEPDQMKTKYLFLSGLFYRIVNIIKNLSLLVHSGRLRLLDSQNHS